MSTLPRFLSFAALSLAVLASPASGATITKLRSATPLDATPTVTLPSRQNVLVIDWVDAKTDRLAIGGLTYAVRASRPRIVLASGEDVSSIGYLRAGMRARIQTSVDETGAQKLVEIRIEP